MKRFAPPTLDSARRRHPLEASGFHTTPGVAPGQTVPGVVCVLAVLVVLLVAVGCVLFA